MVSLRTTLKGIKPTAGSAIEIEKLLNGQYREEFLIRWTPQRPIVLLSLEVKSAPDNLWRQILTNTVGDNDGEMVVDLGLYTQGEIKVRFEIGAISKVPKIATYIVENSTTVHPFKPPLGGGDQSIEQGARWTDNDAYAVGKSP